MVGRRWTELAAARDTGQNSRHQATLRRVRARVWLQPSWCVASDTTACMDTCAEGISPAFGTQVRRLTSVVLDERLLKLIPVPPGPR
jgi:hypothetical protein